MKVGTFFNPVSFFVIWWGTWLFISAFGLLNLYIPSIKTYIFTLIVMIMFSAGCIFTINNKIKKVKFVNLKPLNEYKVKILNIIQIIILIVLTPFLFKSFKYITSMSASVYRTEIYENNILYGSEIIQQLFNFLIQPFMLTMLLLGCCGFILGVKGMKKLFFLSVVNVSVFSVMTLGRWYFLRIILFLILALFLVSIFKNSSKHFLLYFKKRKKNIYFIIAPLFTCVLVLISLFRQNSTSILYTVFEYLIKYFTGSFIALDSFLKDNDFVSFDDWSYGRYTLGGLDEIVVFIFRRIDDTIVNISTQISYYTSDFIKIGALDGQTYKSFYSAIFNFYSDGGILGILIIPFIFGMIIGVLFNGFIKKPNLFNLSLLVYLLYISIVASLRWEVQSPIFWVVIFILVFINTTVKKATNPSDIMYTRS